MDALWAGLPLLAAPGVALASRISASILIHAGLAELVARSLADYADVACALARSRGARKPGAALRARVEALAARGEPRLPGSVPVANARAGRTPSAIFDVARWVVRWERALCSLWDAGAGGTRPMHVVRTQDSEPLAAGPGKPRPLAA